MNPSWHKFCRTGFMEANGDKVVVGFRNGRRQVISVSDEGSDYLLHTKIATPAKLQGIESIVQRAWRRNRNVLLVGFRVDGVGRLIGEVRVPKVGLTAEEFQQYLRALAAESDRFEFLVTGRDLH